MLTITCMGGCFNNDWNPYHCTCHAGCRSPTRNATSVGRRPANRALHHERPLGGLALSGVGVYIRVAWGCVLITEDEVWCGDVGAWEEGMPNIFFKVTFYIPLHQAREQFIHSLSHSCLICLTFFLSLLLQRYYHISGIIVRFGQGFRPRLD